MATSGTVGTTTIDLATILDHSFRRAKVPVTKQTPEKISYALESLHFLLNDLANVGLNLWCIEKVIQGLYKYQESYLTPVGTVDVLDTFLRMSSRAGGTLSSSDSSDVAALEDADILTFSTQTVTGGYWLYSFTDPVAVRTVGILNKGVVSRNLVFQFSQDNVTWNTVKVIGVTQYTDQTWYWYDIEPARSGLYFRIMDTLTNSPLSAYELFIASNIQTEITMARMNRDDFTNLPNKFSAGRPLQFWLDRATPQPTIRVWPSPDQSSIFNQIVYWRHRQIQDVGTDLQLTLEVPPRWLEAVLNGLAYKISLEDEEAPPERITLLASVADKSLGLVEAEEVDKAPMTLRPNLRHYTRS